MNELSRRQLMVPFVWALRTHRVLKGGQLARSRRRDGYGLVRLSPWRQIRAKHSTLCSSAGPRSSRPLPGCAGLGVGDACVTVRWTRVTSDAIQPYIYVTATLGSRDIRCVATLTVTAGARHATDAVE